MSRDESDEIFDQDELYARLNPETALMGRKRPV